MIKIDKNIVHRIDFSRVNKPFDLDNNISNFTYRFERHIAKEMVEKYDESILNLLYQAYKDTECDTLIVLDKSEFKKFILKYLPIYLKEIEQCQD